jgi:DNA-directed RNA polymerase specialized sigma24 family protein
MLGSFDEAEDHVQEVFLRAWRSCELFQDQASPRTWLYRIATNACLDTLRHNARRAVPAPPGARVGPGPSIATMPIVPVFGRAAALTRMSTPPSPSVTASTMSCTDWSWPVS